MCLESGDDISTSYRRHLGNLYERIYAKSLLRRVLSTYHTCLMNVKNAKFTNICTMYSSPLVVDIYSMCVSHC